jgi:heptosyltransferase-2
MAARLDAASAGRIAVYISGNIGDSVLHLGFMRALSEHLQRKLILINPLPPAVNVLFEVQPYIEQVISIREIEKHADKGLRGRLLREKLESLRLDTLFFFNFKSYAAVAALQARIPQRWGFVRRHQFHNALLFTHRVFVQKSGTMHPDTHTWLPALLRRHGLPAEAIYPSLFVDEASAAQAAELTREHPRLIGFGLNASVAARRYPAEKFVEVIDGLLAKDGGYSFLLFGAADVADIASAIRKNVGDRARLLDITAMNLDLRVGSAVIARCRGFISNDSLGLHIAVAHRVPTVGLFGISPPMHYVPWLIPLQAEEAGGMAGIRSATIVTTTLRQMAS